MAPDLVEGHTNGGTLAGDPRVIDPQGVKQVLLRADQLFERRFCEPDLCQRPRRGGNGIRAAEFHVRFCVSVLAAQSHPRSVPDRLKLVERVVHDVAELESPSSKGVEAAALLGMMADEPELMDDVMAHARHLRARLAVRASE